MLNILSVKCQKEIALVFISLFFISGLSSLKAQTSLNVYVAPTSYSSRSNIVVASCKSNSFLGIDSKNINKEFLNEQKTDVIKTPKPLLLKFKTPVDSLTDNQTIKKIRFDQGNFSQKPLIGGPGQPEMSAFKPVGADNMADPFTGDFSYNIPLLDVSGYPVNMFYNSGITMDQDASWLGLGWNINPGTIMRNMRGIPDDFNGTDIITKRQSIRPDQTWGVSAGAGLKFAGFPMIGLDVNAGLSFNNKLGLALEAGIHPSLSISARAGDEKTASLSFGANLSASSRNGASVTPSVNVSITKSDAESGTSKTGSLGLSYTQTSRSGVTGLHLDAGLSKSMCWDQHSASSFYRLTSVSGTEAALSSSISFAYPTIVPSIKSIFTRRSYNLSFSVGGEFYGLNGYGRLAGYYTESRIDEADQKTEHPAYGMLNYQKANNNPNALLDFNRANDGVYTPNSPAIALPVYTYDVFSINGEGTGGSFRATRNDLGYMRDASVKTREDEGSLGLDLGFGNTVHGGAEFSYAHTPSEVGGWNVNNMAKNVFQFQENNGAYQSVYFKNPGEKTIPDANFQNTIGGENLVRLKMSNTGSGTALLLPKLIKYDANKNVIGEKVLNADSVIRPGRDKRTQVISFLTAEEAYRIGFDKKIYSYATDSTKIIFVAACDKTGIDSFDRFVSPADAEGADRKAHHISEIDVLGTDGRKYVYGIPVYNTKQVDVSFSVENGDNTTGKSSYAPHVDDTVLNKKGRDWFMNQEEMPAYTHSFLLSALVSPNYVDVTGDGITEDDMGDAVKFNYTKFNQGFQWRTPIGSNDGTGSASYSEGLKTDKKDDKAHYIYGEREMWHLYSIESKNMVARFYVKNDRLDCKQVLGQSGGLDNNWGMQRLDKISLYSKGDLMKEKETNGGVKAKPIKTVKFFQSYKLCKNMDGTSNSVGTNGKLTLDSIWISYNGNQKKAKSKYVFSYPTDKNPNYEYNGNDRWGNYKPADKDLNNNPGGLSNADYPYSIQDKTKADNYAASWVMNKILLPTGGVINVDFESDDYAYVQNKKAANMFGVVGFGERPNPNITTNEQTNPFLFSPRGGKEYDYVYVQLTYPITSTNITEQQRELTARYFENTNQLFMKIAVIMPSTPGLTRSELIPVYADIEKFGIVLNTGGNIAYIQVRKVDGGSTPMVQQALQFIKQQLPGKAYPGYDVSDKSTAKGVVMALAGMITSVAALKMGEDAVLKSSNTCREVETVKSFVRLTNPYLTKYGGGLRVKKVTINDNWDKMTNQYEASYGQEYKYTTTELINGALTTISSGIASWEPSMGGDENPHKEIMRYMNHNRSGPYDFGAIEMPLGEMFYPSPLVGYSRVEVLSIHRDTVKNLPTRQVTEFYTTKDFPFQSSCTQLSDPEANVKYEPSAVKQLLRLDMKKAITQSQGFLVDMNDMNGKVKIQATYSALDSVNAVSFTQNFYRVEKATDKTYKFNHTFPTISKADGIVDNNSLIGRDIELMADFREHTTETITTNINVNFDFFFLGIFPIPLTNLLQPTIYEGTTYRSASLLKIVNHYGMLDSVVVIDKGSMVSTKNLVYDAETGNPLLTRTNNEHNRPVYNFSYPAHWAYSGMGPAYKNIDANYTGLTFRNGKLETAINMGIFESGDELYVMAKNSRGPRNAYPCDGSVLGRLPKNTENKIWAVNTGKVGSATPQFVFMDKSGNPYTAYNVTMRIVRSGHRNMLDQMAGSISSLKNPVHAATGQLEFNDATNIIQTNAATFKDHWRVDNAFYQVDSLVTVQTLLQVNHTSFNPTENLSLVDHKCFGNAEHQFFPFYNKDYFNSQFLSLGDGVHTKYFAQSWAMYDFSRIPTDATILKASLSLSAHTSVHSQKFDGLGRSDCDMTIGHGATNPHNDILHNDFYITRAKKTWSNTFNHDQWYDFYYNSGYIDWKNIVAPGPTYSINKSYNCDSKRQIDDRPDITLMVGKMIAEKNRFPTGIKLSERILISPNWNSPDWKKNKDLPTVCFQQPIVDIYYTTCSDNASLINDGQGCYLSFPEQYCTSSQHQLFCLSKFTKKAINPYVEGILGNWRVDTAFVYYGERKESDPNIPLDTRTAGTIINFNKFWNFNANYLQRNLSASDVWVWNSTITQYNRKGYEIENKDPLGRFNSGLYGYNQQLPVAVANNARVREIMFDGFEDYDYQTALNCISCKSHRHANFEGIESFIDTAQKHTGRYSLRLDGGSTFDLKAPVTDITEANKGYGLRVKVDSVAYIDTLVTGHGSGWTGQYAGYYCGLGWSIPNPDNFGTVQSNRIDPQINLQCDKKHNCTSGTPPAGIQYLCSSGEYYKVRWEGYIQPLVTGIHYFKTISDDGIRVKIQTASNNTIINNWSVHAPTQNTSENNPVYLIKGNVYKVQVDYFQARGDAYGVLLWKYPGMADYDAIPTQAVYPVNNIADTAGSVMRTLTWCTKLDTVQVYGNALTDTFSLIQNKKMVLSAWVKEGGNDCKCSTYIKNGVVISYTGNGQTETLQPAGNIIEGWQRYESVFTIPANATAIKVSLNNYNASGGDTLYFDDIRIHPFNANLKSFVYHSSNLRLMAELDENNYATFYEYDDDGTLTRVKKETINGIKTITETRSAIQKTIQ
jgi:PA14 domain